MVVDASCPQLRKIFTGRHAPHVDFFDIKPLFFVFSDYHATIPVLLELRILIRLSSVVMNDFSKLVMLKT